MGDNRSYSQRKRDKMDYRREYFKHNPGLFGCIWTCAYCHRVLVGERNVQVDHIMPLNNVLGRNAGYNLVAACGKCNRNKSDKVDGRVIKGYVSKCIEVVLFSIQKAIVIALVAVWTCLRGLITLATGLVCKPYRNTGIVVKLVATMVYAGLIYVGIHGF